MKLLKNLLISSMFFIPMCNVVYADTPDDAAGQTKGSYFQSNVGQSVDDATITTAVSTKLLKDREIKPFQLKVATNNGIVSLSGQVDTDKQFDNAVTITESVDGVKDVDTTNLNVKGSDQPVSDSIITAKIKGKIMQAKMFTSNDVKYWSVHVKTTNGIVYLTGNVDTQDQKDNITEIAKSVDGVQSVDASGLVVGQ